MTCLKSIANLLVLEVLHHHRRIGLANGKKDMDFGTASEEDLRAAFDNIADYTNAAQQQIYLETVKRGLFLGERRSFVLSQIRDRIAGLPPSTPVAALDISKSARLCGIMQRGPRYLTLLGSIYLFIGGFALLGWLLSYLLPYFDRNPEGPGVGNGTFYSFVGLLSLLFASKMRRNNPSGAKGTIWLLGPLIPVWGLMAGYDLFSDGTLNDAIPFISLILAVLSLASAIAVARYIKRRKQLGLPCSTAMALQGKYIQNWIDTRVRAALFATIACFITGLFLVFNASSAKRGGERVPLLDLFYGSSESKIALAGNLGAVLMLIVTPFLWAMARRLAMVSARALRSQDERNPILYLRSFGDEKIYFWRFRVSHG